MDLQVIIPQHNQQKRAHVEITTLPKLIDYLKNIFSVFIPKDDICLYLLDKEGWSTELADESKFDQGNKVVTGVSELQDGDTLMLCSIRGTLRPRGRWVTIMEQFM
jgi:hypothetical protein